MPSSCFPPLSRQYLGLYADLGQRPADLVAVVGVHDDNEVRPYVGQAGGSDDLLTGARDTFNNCCLVETMEQFRVEAQRRGAPLELVVYPEAQHGFNLRVPFFREADAADAWKRLIEFLSRR